MDKKELTKKLIAGAVILGALAGAFWGASGYWTGGTFQPTENERALKNNQVLFDDQKNSLSQERGDTGDSFWEDRNAGDKVSGNQQPGYLFSPDEVAPEATTAGIVGADTGTAGTNAPGVEVTTRPGGTNGTVIGGTTGGTSGGTAGGGTGGSAQPTTPGSSVTGDGTVSNPYRGDSVLPDPGKDKEAPSTIPGLVPIHITDKAKFDVKEVIVRAPAGTELPPMYKGQVVDAAAIFNSLDSFVYTVSGDVYYWSGTDLGKLFRIDSISFDRNTWISMTGSATVTVPLEADTMYIKVSYRYRSDGDWIEYDKNPVAYPLKDSRIFLLNTTVKNESKIQKSQLVNFDSDTERLAVGDIFNLSGQLQRLVVQRESIPNGQVNNSPVLKKLFPGWTENGKPVDWHYPITVGRHVLQAPKSVDYDTKSFRIVLRHYWMESDYSLSTAEIPAADSLSYLQVLTAYTGRSTKTLRPPVYTQGVDFSRDSALTVDTLSLPNTVLYVNTDGVGENGFGLRVTKSYEADEGNPRYTAKDGILYNKDCTEILGVPTAVENLTVPEGVTRVSLPYGCGLKTLTVTEKNAAQFPDVNYARLPSGSTLVVDGEVLEEVLRAKADSLRSANLYVASIQDPNTVYRVRDSLILRGEDGLHGVLDTEVRWLSVPENVTGMEEGCLKGLEKLTMVYLPANGEEMKLEKGCFDEAPKLETVVCYSEAQYAAACAVAPEGVHVLLAGVTDADGYRYLDMGGGRIQLLGVPKDIQSFTGVIPGADGSSVTVTAIGNDAFSGCVNLRWVDLVPEVTAIGQNAFRGCTGLEGVVIGAKDSVMIGKGAFDGCTSLRFLASNALNCDLRSPELTLPCELDPTYCFLFCPLGGQGYNFNWVHFKAEDHITGYKLKDCGGTRVLYGLTDNEAWLAIRAGKTIEGDVSLPEDTSVIYISCFQDAQAAAGSFNLNWQELEYLREIKAYGFRDSGLGADVELPTEMIIGKAAFAGCTALEQLTIPGDCGDIRFSDELFYGCTALTRVTIGGLSRDSSISNGLFSGCSSLKELIFTDAPPRLSVYEFGNHFHFNLSQWGNDEAEEEHLKVIVPEGREEEFVNEWRCGFAGYPGNQELTGYQAMWQGVYEELKGNSPSDEDIRREVERRLLVGENHVRALLGLEKTDAVSHHFAYTVDENNRITLTEANDAEYVELTAATLDMPDGWVLDYIGPQAFRNSPRLMQVTLPESLLGIYNEPFSGVERTREDPLNVIVSSDDIPELMGFEQGVPYSFGLEDDCIQIMYLSGGDPEAILKKWLLPMAGYETLEDLAADAALSLEEPTADAVTQAVLEKLLAAENRLRTMVQYLEPVDSAEELTGITREEIDAAVASVLPDQQLQTLDPEEPVPLELEFREPQAEVPEKAEEEEAADPAEPLKPEEPASGAEEPQEPAPAADSPEASPEEADGEP